MVGEDLEVRKCRVCLLYLCFFKGEREEYLWGGGRGYCRRLSLIIEDG